MKNSIGQLKKWGPWISNILFFGIVVFILVQRAPSWIRQMKMEGTPGGIIEVIGREGQKVVLPPAGGKPSILIFWATWCGPCTVELKRFAAAVRDGELRAEQIYAISLGEDPALVQKTAEERRYPFSVFSDPTSTSGSVYGVQGTPTVVHLDGTGAVKWVTSGLSPTGIWRAKKHLN